MPETDRAESQAFDDAGDTLAGRKRDNAGMEIEQLEQIAAVIVTAGLVAGNFLMFTPWRNGEDPRQRPPESLMPQDESVFFRSLNGIRHERIQAIGFVIPLGRLRALLELFDRFRRWFGLIAQERQLWERNP